MVLHGSGESFLLVILLIRLNLSRSENPSSRQGFFRLGHLPRRLKWVWSDINPISWLDNLATVNSNSSSYVQREIELCLSSIKMTEETYLELLAKQVEDHLELTLLKFQRSF